MNTKFSIKEYSIPGLKVITPFCVEDERGYFAKNYEKDIYKEWGIDVNICEEFETLSSHRVIRGLHFQTNFPQAKMVRVIKGCIRDVVVDLRKGSDTFGQYADIILSDENHLTVWIPKGFAHGFEVLSSEAIVSYMCVGKYMKEYDTGIRWNDSTLGIKWQTQEPIVSAKDSALMSFNEFVRDYGGFII